MLRWFPRLQVATACFSCRPSNLNFLDPYFIFMCTHYNHCHRVTAHLQLHILYYYILCYLHFTDNRNEPDRTDKNFDRLWKIQDLFEILNAAFSKFYNPSKNLVIDKVIVSFKGRVIFKQYIPTKCKHFNIKIFKLCDSTGYTYDVKVYLGKDRQCMAQHVTVTHVTLTELMRKIEGCDHKLYMANFFSSPELFGLGQETDLLLWHCQAEQERHATRPSTKDIKTEKGRHSHKIKC